MSSIRNLSTFDIGGGGNRRRTKSQTDGELSASFTSIHNLRPFGSANDSRPHRRSMYSAFGGSTHHVAGEVMSSSSFQPNHNFSSWRRFSVSKDYNMTDVPENGSISPHPPPKEHSPPSGRFRKLRSSTWDSSGMRLSPKLLSKSNSLDSPCSGDSVPIGLGLGGQEGDNSTKATKFVFEDGEGGLYHSESDSENEEDKCEAQDMHVLDRNSVLTPVHEVIDEAQKLSPKREGDSDVVTNQYDETKGILKTKRSSNFSVDSSGNSVSCAEDVTEEGRSVTFAEDVPEAEEGRRESRPSFCAKLPALTHWDETDESERSMESSHSSPIVGRNGKGVQFQRQNSQPTPSLLDKLNPFGNLSWSIVGSCIVRTAPCFWCSKKLGISVTDREILMRLNLLCALFCLVQICFGVFLFFMKVTGYVEHDANEDLAFEDDKDKPLVSTELWSLELFVFGLSVINLVLLIASMLAQRAIREVNIVASVRFMWVLFWLLPIQIFCMIGLFDYFYVHEVKVKHWWDDPSMREFREIFCEKGTANTKCKVPILGGIDFESEEDWCQAKYNNSTDCRDIRDEAQNEYNVTSRILYTANGIWALVLVVLMWVTLCLLQAIITMPIVQRSKESNIPLWLTFPIVGCYTIGALLHYSQTSVTKELQDVLLIAMAYLISGGAFTLAALVGLFLKCYTVLNGRQRRIKQGVVVVFIVTIFLSLFAVGTIFVTSLIYSLGIINLPTEEPQDIACVLDMSGSCTGCEPGDPGPKCPEWTEEDVQDVLDTIMKQSATLAAIFLVYALITLRYGFLLFRYVSRYQIEYV